MIRPLELYVGLRYTRADIDLGNAVQGLLGMVNISVMAAFHGLPVPPDQTENLLDLFFNGVAPR